MNQGSAKHSPGVFQGFITALMICALSVFASIACYSTEIAYQLTAFIELGDFLINDRILPVRHAVEALTFRPPFTSIIHREILGERAPYSYKEADQLVLLLELLTQDRITDMKRTLKAIAPVETSTLTLPEKQSDIVEINVIDQASLHHLLFSWVESATNLRINRDRLRDLKGIHAGLIDQYTLLRNGLMDFCGFDISITSRDTSHEKFDFFSSGILAGLPKLRELNDDIQGVQGLVAAITQVGGKVESVSFDELKEKIEHLKVTATSLQKEVDIFTRREEKLKQQIDQLEASASPRGG